MIEASLGRRHVLEAGGLLAIVALAAVLRLVDLPTRGTWDADQGHDMLVLRNLVLNGQVPLLGPPTSIGDFHHGVLYYLLLAPAAAISGADPTAVTAWIALGGVAAVGVVGWLARAIGGPVAGLVTAFLLAVSASAVEESVFIWNPNVIALSSSIALAAAWHAWEGGGARWWVVAGAAAVVTMHGHVLGAILTPVIAGLLVADVRRRRRSGDADGARSVSRAALGWIGIGLLSGVPLLIHEVASGGAELRAAVAFVAGGGGEAAIGLPSRIPIVALRVLGWPLAGLITAAPVATVLVSLLVVASAVWLGWVRMVGPGPSPSAGATPPASAAERVAARWLGLGLAWTIAALAIGASSLATVVPGLPNDHYHAFADPLVVVLAGLGIGALVREAGPGVRSAPALAAAVIVVALGGWNLARQPPRVVADGGWPAARLAAQRVIAAGGGGPYVLASLPTFKSDEALRFPLEGAGVELIERGIPAASVDPSIPRVILCDQLFRASIGADCGGPAEGALLATALPTADPPSVVDRFEAAPGRWISIYRP
ncbi:MAG TPA: glycosyltransferase family 39 protein [Candidatus Limnocylindrales bacterium]|nr:glycosyltransferase family 39 protein [Candidatus Limnocylindrales bacterium]